MIQCAICDDDPEMLAILHGMIETYPNNLTCTVFSDASKLISAIRQGQRNDLYILDIVMPKITGMDLAQEIRKSDRDCIIIFLTSSDEFHREAFGVDALQYLSKPLEKDALYHTLDRALQYIGNKGDDILPIQTKTGIYALHINQIVYAESFRHIITFHLCDGSTVDTLDSSLTLKKLMDLLCFPPFSVPYRGFIMNLDYVDCLKKLTFSMTTGAEIPIPQKQFAKIRQQYSDYLLKRCAKGEYR